MIPCKIRILFFFSLLLYSQATSGKENFIFINGKTDEIIAEMGSLLNERISPCSTFKIPLSLMGFDSGILKNSKTPTWEFEDRFDDFLQEWQDPQTPNSWIKCPCVWFSKILAIKLGSKNLRYYLSVFDYGNQDISGGLTTSGIFSSLKISANEQVEFLQKMVCGKLFITYEAVKKAKNLLFIENLDNGQKLFGKTGGSSYISNNKNQKLEWFVGWVEVEHQQTFYPFAYHIQGDDVNVSQTILRVKELIQQHL